MSTFKNCTITTVNITINNYTPSKQCAKYKIVKPLIEYHKDRTHSDGYRSSCKSCRSESRKSESQRTTRRQYENQQYHSNEQYKITKRLRIRLNDSIRLNRESARTIELLGCSLEHFKHWIESQFTPEMTWRNHGKYWEFDHVQPFSSFDLTDPIQQRECFSWKNTQPLTKLENNKKHTTRDLELETSHALKVKNFLDK